MTYEELRHALDTAMLRASGLTTDEARQDFVTTTFTSIYRDYEAKRIDDHAVYVKLVNRLAGYAGGAYNDYVDLLAGAATMGMLNTILAQKKGSLAEDARKRSQAITEMTGVEPVQPEEDE